MFFIAIQNSLKKIWQNVNTMYYETPEYSKNVGDL